MKKLEVVFEKDKDTKNTLRFKEVPGEGKPPVMGSIYLQKWFTGDSDIKKVKVTVEEVE
jgi:hypothetical protein